MFRHHYWRIEIDETAVNHARKKGLDEVRIWAVNRLDKRVSAPSKALFRDGMQTPLHGRVVYYAQHATASCCRKCMEEWHGIDRNQFLTEDQINYLTELIMLYIRGRLPTLSQHVETIPRPIPVG